MTYEKYKTVIFRVCVFLTVFIEVLAFLRHRGLFGLNFENTVFGTPILIWGTYFFGFWIYKGFLDKE